MNLPENFLEKMKLYLGDEYEDFIASYDKPEVKGLRFNTEAPGDILGALCDMENKPENMPENEVQNKPNEVFRPVPWVEYAYSYVSEPVGNIHVEHTFSSGLNSSDAHACVSQIGDNAISVNLQNLNIRPGKHPYHEAGAYYIQEPAAMAPAVYLDAKPGDRVLDLCAAPGGKSTQIGYMMKGEGILVSNEIMRDRAKILSENIERMGISNALVISEDPRDISGRFEGFFDKILVDAPCSGEGMFRRLEAAVNEWSQDNVLMCAERQAWILDEAAKMLRPGGRLVYSTCTFSKEEDEDTIAAFLERHDDFALENMTLYGGMRKGFGGIGVRLWPHLIEGEGHFVCALVKISPNHEMDLSDSSHTCDIENIQSLTDTDSISGRAHRLAEFVENEYKTVPPCGYEHGIKFMAGDVVGTSGKNKSVAGSVNNRIGAGKGKYNDKNKSGGKSDLDELYKFVDNNLTDKEFLQGRTLVRFKDQIYMIPKECPNLAGLKVLRPGLHLGEMLKNRFEPAHALARTLKPGDVRLNCILRENNTEVFKYINGETFFMPMQNGWYVIYFNEYPLGWGKITNEIVKNHYPKGLRKNLNS